jgi:hypothetical protein
MACGLQQRLQDVVEAQRDKEQIQNSNRRHCLKDKLMKVTGVHKGHTGWYVRHNIPVQRRYPPKRIHLRHALGIVGDDRTTRLGQAQIQHRVESRQMQ